MSAITLSGITKSFGGTQVLKDVSLSIAYGELFFLLGPSGCGKTTLLRTIAGLESADSGRVLLGERDITNTPPYKRGIGMVFQQYALWPHMTVFQNISFGLKMKQMAATEINARVQEVLHQVKLEELANRFPHELSGGQQQRVALARAVAPKPEVLLLDEPLSNLDARLRDSIRRELAEIHSSLGITMVYVTHDQEDALTLASRVAVMRHGDVVQIATPHDLYTSPVDTFVNSFMGDSNTIVGNVVGRQGEKLSVELLGRTLYVSRYSPKVLTSVPSVTYAIRPEDISVSRASERYAESIVNEPERINFSGSVSSVLYRGNSSEVEVALEQPSKDGAIGVVVKARVFGKERAELQVGDHVQCAWPATAAIVLPCDRPSMSEVV